VAIGACVITALPMLRRAPLVAIEGGLIEVLDLDEVLNCLPVIPGACNRCGGEKGLPHAPFFS